MDDIYADMSPAERVRFRGHNPSRYVTPIMFHHGVTYHLCVSSDPRSTSIWTCDRTRAGTSVHVTELHKWRTI